MGNSVSVKAVSLGCPDTDVQQSVLMIHGFAADRLSWTATAPHLYTKHAVWAVDLPGHGKSLPVTPALTLEGIADQLTAEFLRLADSQPLHLVGHSLGGALSLLLAEKHPQQVASLTLLAPAGLGVGQGSGVNSAFMQELYSLKDNSSALAALQKIVHDPKLVSEQLAAMMLQQLDKDGVREALKTTANALTDAASLSPILGSVAHKSMLVWGKQDNINPCLPAEQLSVPARWHTLDDCGHLPHVEHRVKVNQLIGDFIAEQACTPN